MPRDTNSLDQDYGHVKSSDVARNQWLDRRPLPNDLAQNSEDLGEAWSRRYFCQQGRCRCGHSVCISPLLSCHNQCRGIHYGVHFWPVHQLVQSSHKLDQLSRDALICCKLANDSDPISHAFKCSMSTESSVTLQHASQFSHGSLSSRSRFQVYHRQSVPMLCEHIGPGWNTRLARGNENLTCIKFRSLSLTLTYEWESAGFIRYCSHGSERWYVQSQNGYLNSEQERARHIFTWWILGIGNHC